MATSNDIRDHIKRIKDTVSNEPDTAAIQLIELQKSRATKHVFKVGDLIQWKKGMRMTRLPYGNPAIITEILDTPIKHSSRDTGEPYWNTDLDVRVGIMDSDGDFLEFYTESNRYEPYVFKSQQTIN